MKKVFVLVLLLLGVVLVGCEKETDFEVRLNEGTDIIGLYDQHIDEGCLLVSSKDTYDMEVVSNMVNVNQAGNYKIFYQYETNDGTVYECERNVKVIDDVPPVVTLNDGDDVVEVGTTHIDAGVTATDETSDVTITVDNLVDTSIPGSYGITYRVRDRAGNETVKIRVVLVVE
jgi:hypothetical protein